MDMLKKLSQEWVKSESYDSGVQKRIWDRVAQNYGDLNIPDLQENAFLKTMTQALPLQKDMRTLDIGCGSGVFSMALAPYVQEAVGVDISSNMIQYAVDRSRSLGLSNTSFCCLDWSEADIDAMGFRNAFDIVFAHMTPGVNDYKTFDRLNACSRNICMIEKPTRRTDRVMDEAFRLIGLDRSRDQYDGGILQVFTYLWYKGYCPQFYYHTEQWHGRKTLDDAIGWIADRARQFRGLSVSDETTIREYVTSQAVDGIVEEVTNTTRVTVVWSVK